MTDKKIYPVCVIGGGSAGVMSVLRTVLNNDECLFFPGSPKNKKKSRAFWVSKIENMPAHLPFKKGIEDPNRETLKWLSEGSFKEKLIHQKNQGVIDLKKDDDDLFVITSSKDEVFYAKFVILCTGVMDIQPTINGSIDPILPYANLQTADYCLRCDGHHSLGKNLTVIGNGDGAAWVGIMLKERYNCPSVTILTNGEKLKSFSDEVSELVKLYQMKVNEQQITQVLGDPKAGKLEGFTFSDGSSVDSDFCFISLGMIVYNELAKSLGAELDSRGFVKTNDKGESTVSGLYVAGDLRANAKKQVYTAWDHAVDSADKINALLRQERRQQLLSAR